MTVHDIRETALDGRLALLLAEWGSDGDDVTGGLDPALADVSTARLWQTFVVAFLAYPSEHQFTAFAADVKLLGASAAIQRVAERRWRNGREIEPESMEFVRDVVLIDINHTTRTAKTTGIQRVVRETTLRWNERPEVRLVVWNAGKENGNGTYMRALAENERAAFLRSEEALDFDAPFTIVVPLSGRVLIPEINLDIWRAGRTAAIARYSGLEMGVVGYDMVPLTSAETTTHGTAGHFPLFLEAISHAARIAPISEACAHEFRGWRRALSSIGLNGPDIHTVGLAAEAPGSGAIMPAEFRRVTGLGELEQIVLVVGSHEPRKNHLAVLHAAELLWREGRRFALVFIGGGGWHSEDFTERAAAMGRRGRRIVLLEDANDEQLSAAYRAARFTVFPSLHEGFGLPVAESIASGTPVITSNFGSTREIVDEHRAGLLVDPRNDRAITDAMRVLLVDEQRLVSLASETADASLTGWDEYATRLWAYLCESVAA